MDPQTTTPILPVVPPVSTQEANPGKAITRTLFALLPLFPIVNGIIAAVNEWATDNSASLPAWVFPIVNGALLVSVLITALVTKILAVPGVNEWLRRGGIRSLLAPDNEPSVAAKDRVDEAAGTPPPAPPATL